MEYLSVNNWKSFQHYKERNPPWIKLHRSLLNDYDFACLQDASKLHLMLIWLLASQMNNEIPADPEYIKRALHLSETPDLNELIDKGFLLCSQDASAVLAGCKQNALLETETETEKNMRANDTKSETKKDNPLFEDFWSCYPKKVNKKKSAVAFSRLSMTKQQAAIADLKSGRYHETEKRFVPDPTTYIHGERWSDERMAHDAQSSLALGRNTL